MCINSGINFDLNSTSSSSNSIFPSTPAVCPTCNTCPTCGRTMGTWTYYPTVTFGDATASVGDVITFTLDLDSNTITDDLHRQYY